MGKDGTFVGVSEVGRGKGTQDGRGVSACVGEGTGWLATTGLVADWLGIEDG